MYLKARKELGLNTEPVTLLVVTAYDRRIRRPISKARLSNLGLLTSCLVLDHDSSANPCTSCEVNSLNLIRRFKIFLNIRQTSTK